MSGSRYALRATGMTVERRHRFRSINGQPPHLEFSAAMMHRISVIKGGSARITDNS